MNDKIRISANTKKRRNTECSSSEKYVNRLGNSSARKSNFNHRLDLITINL